MNKKDSTPNERSTTKACSTAKGPSPLWVLLTFALLAGIIPFQAHAFEARLDLNADGSINDLDMILLKKAIAGEPCSGARGVKTCDVNEDGTVTMEDYFLLDAYLHPTVQQALPTHGVVDLKPEWKPPASVPGMIPGMIVPTELIEVGKPFALHPGGSATLTATDGFMLFLTGIDKVVCLRPGSCPDYTAQLEIRMRKDTIPRLWTVNEGDSQSIGNYKITVSDIEDSIHQVTLLVERTGATPVEHDLEPIQILLGSPSKLRKGQQGYTDRFTITLNQLERLPCPNSMQIPVRQYQQGQTGIPAIPSCPPPVSHLDIETRNGARASFTIPLHGFATFQDQSDTYRITYTAQADLDVGVFIVSTQQESITTLQRRVAVTPNTPFKLQPGGTGFVLGSDSVEFTVTSITLPHCTSPFGQDMRPLPHSEADMPLPPVCTPGSLTISLYGKRLEMQTDKPFPLNNRYSLEVRGIYGTETGQQTAELMVVENQPRNTEKPPACPQFMPPSPDWCKDGITSPGKEDEHGCKGPPQCVMPGSDRDEHGCIPSAGYSWCSTKNTCLRIWEEPCEMQPPPQQPPQPLQQPPLSPQPCQGCKLDERCLPTGSRLASPQSNTPSYCSLDGTLTPQKPLSMACQNNYECTSNTCADSVCTSLQERLTGIEKEVKEQRGILDKILGFFKRLFGMAT